MRDFQSMPTGEKRNAPIWQVFAIVIVLMALATSSFYYGSKHPSSGISGGSNNISDSGANGGTDYYDSGSSGAGGQVQTYILNNFIGYGSTSVERTIRASGLFVNTRYTNGDPSINAQLNNGCTVVDQSPPSGSEVYAGSTVIILADCPLTGQG